MGADSSLRFSKDRLDPEPKVQAVQKPRRFFRLGKVFAMRWVEPYSYSERESQLSKQQSTNAPDTDVFSEIRRFIVVHESHGASQCVPIHTYGGRGVRKCNIKIEDHARVFRYDSELSTPPSEQRLREPIGVVIDKSSEFQRFHPESVANFGKVYTVEHDVAVANIGYVVRAHNYRLQLNWVSPRSQATLTAPGSLRVNETIDSAPPLTSSETISPISDTTFDLNNISEKSQKQPTAEPATDYAVLILCALSSEMTAVRAILDEERHMSVNDQHQSDHDDILGRLLNHNVVLAKRPAVMFGSEAIGGAVQETLQTYSLIRVVLVVGTRKGWMPQRRRDGPGEEGINLIPWAKDQVERSAAFRSTRHARPPSNVFIKALSRLQDRLEWGDNQIGRELSEILKKYPDIRRKYASPRPFTELPAQQDCDHFALKCEESGSLQIISQKGGGAEAPGSRQSSIGLDGQISNSVAEYSLCKELTVSCSEEEGAGTMLDFSFLDIQGIYDHFDSYKKNQGWQVNAAAAAAAYTKVLLSTITTEDVRQEKLVLQSDSYEMDEEQTECHRVLKTSNYENFKDLNASRVSNTCEWFLDRSEYKEWLQSSQDLLWFSADPGCGKSVLSKYLVDHKLQNTEKNIVCYFFFKDNTKQDRLAVALCALLHQFFHYRPQLLRFAMDAFRKNGEKLQNEVDELWRIFITSAKHTYSNRVICFLDGLDECREDDQKKLFQLLRSFYNAPEPVKSPQLKFFITSRPYLDIEYLFRELPSIRLAGEKCNDAIGADINLVVKDELCKLNLRPDVQDMLEIRLMAPSNRTYLWARLMLEDLRDPRHKQTKKGFEKALRYLPKPLEVEYEKILSRINHNRRHKADILLRIVVDAYRPLTLSELDVAFELAAGGQDSRTHDDLDLDLDEESIASRLRDLCGLFIYIDDSRIFLIHQSAKEYLVNTYYPRLALDKSWPNFQVLLSPNELLVDICVQYLSLEDFNYNLHHVESGADDKESAYPFLEYSATYLANHFRQATVDDDKLLPRIYELYNNHSQKFENWYRISQDANAFKGAPNTSLQLAAFSGHLRMVLHLLEAKEFERDTEHGNMCKALYWAALGGNEQIVSILIENGTDVNARISEPTLVTPNGECEKLKFMLLDSGADDISRSLLTASSEDYMGILQLLSESCTHWNEHADFSLYALSQTYAGYQRSHGRLSLDYQDTTAHFAFYGNALQAAAQGGYTSVVQLLLDRGADVNVRGGYFGNALQAAARGGYSSIVDLLLDRGADINAPGGFYGNGLQAAARGGHRIIVEYLVDEGADVNASRGFYGTPLQAAARLGHKTIVQLLISRGADVNAQGGLYGTALQAAVTGGYEDIANLLLDMGAHIYAEGGFYGNNLEAATRASHQRLIQLLHRRGFYVTQGSHGHASYGSSFERSISTSADRPADGKNLSVCAVSATSDDGGEENLMMCGHEPSQPHPASSPHRRNDHTSRPPKKRKCLP